MNMSNSNPGFSAKKERLLRKQKAFLFSSALMQD